MALRARPTAGTGERSPIRLCDLGRGTGEWFDEPSTGDERQVDGPPLSHDGRYVVFAAAEERENLAARRRSSVC
ncbi:hypothetical protein [Streptomyces sp. P9-A2]|uniref:hypothetical protein n=1 Tax=Streptomyces sp. P9-A2 TaxID=3072284 RepID=UPI002FCC8436